jgi:hypothetical protein
VTSTLGSGSNQFREEVESELVGARTPGPRGPEASYIAAGPTLVHDLGGHLTAVSPTRVFTAAERIPPPL